MTQTPEVTVLHLEYQFNQAVLNRDIATAQSLLAESYFLAIGIEGRPLTIISRAKWLDTLSCYMLDSDRPWSTSSFVGNRRDKLIAPNLSMLACGKKKRSLSSA